jgi:ubiquinone/menaquinone biosynthesis C-methylase UbiE
VNARPGWLPGLFDRWSGFYDSEVAQRFLYRPAQDRVVEILREHGVRSSVDVGCGTGIMADRIARELRADVTGCDLSTGMLEQARARNADVTWLQADAADLPLEDASVDAVTSTAAFHWFPDQAAALREFRRVLRPGGLVIIALPTLGGPLGARLVTVASRVLGQVADWPSREHLRNMIEAAGLTVRERRVPRIGDAIMPWTLHIGELSRDV